MAFVTGTDGKTSTVASLDAILRAGGWRVATVDSFGVQIDGVRVGGKDDADVGSWPAHANGIAIELGAIADRLSGKGPAALIIEAPSYWLSLGLAERFTIDVGAVTSLGHDHLDIHGDLAAYHRLKARVPARAAFSVLGSGVCERLAELDALPPPSRAKQVGAMGLSARWTNHAIAVDIARHLGIDVATILATPPPGLPGRAERFIRGARDPVCIVDSAHTPGAIALALREARAMTTGRVIALTGAGGDRDVSKRAAMGRALARGADLAVVTDDNPRFEAAEAIRADIMDGYPDALEVAGRDAALDHALAAAGPSDVVALLGLGAQRVTRNDRYSGDRTALIRRGFRTTLRTRPRVNTITSKAQP